MNFIFKIINWTCSRFGKHPATADTINSFILHPQSLAYVTRGLPVHWQHWSIRSAWIKRQVTDHQGSLSSFSERCLSLSRSLGNNLRHSPFSHQDTRKNRRWNELIGSCEKCEMNVETGRRAFAITAVKNTEYLWFIPTEFYLNFFVPFELEVSNQYFVADELRLCLSAKVKFRLGWLADSLSVIYLTLKTCFRHTTEFLDSHYSVL